MPSILKVRIISANGLPSAYKQVRVELHLDPRQISLATPFVGSTEDNVWTWNEDFRMELPDDSILQDRPFECRVVGRETTVGVVLIDLNALLVESGAEALAGGFPLMHPSMGITGELRMQCRLEVFGDRNPWKESSAGVEVLAITDTSRNEEIAAIRGLVDAVLALPQEDFLGHRKKHRFTLYDRQVMLQAATGELRRLLGLKAASELHADAVMGFQMHVDWISRSAGFGQKSGNVMAVARAIGTGVQLAKNHRRRFSTNSTSSCTTTKDEVHENQLEEVEHGIDESSSSSSESGPVTGNFVHGVPLLTLTRLPDGTIRSIGGIVAAKAVKLQKSNSDLSGQRQEWLEELRQEVREHAKMLRCNLVYGYTEQVISLGSTPLCLVTVQGTAARCDWSQMPGNSESRQDDASEDVGENQSTATSLVRTQNSNDEVLAKRIARRERRQRLFERFRTCFACHLPYRRARSPFPGAFQWCKACHRRHVPEVLLATCDLPTELECLADRNLIEAYVCKPIQKASDSNIVEVAKAVSTALPFVEYEIHRQLLYRLRLLGSNSAWSLSYHIQLVKFQGEIGIVGIATGTAVVLRALPIPEPLRCVRTLPARSENLESGLEERSEHAIESIRQQIDALPSSLHEDSSSSSSDSSSSSESSESSSSDQEETDPLSFVQIDDQADVGLLQLLSFEPRTHDFCTTDEIRPGFMHPCYQTVEFRLTTLDSLTLARCLEGARLKALGGDQHHSITRLSYQFSLEQDILAIFIAASIWKTERLEEEILLTPTSHIPDTTLIDHKGHLSLHLNRQPIQSCTLSDLLYVAKSHVQALGGNVMLGTHIEYVNQIAGEETPMLELSISGDVQLVEYEREK